jgi:P4 family phage/plasmid primase-like protien
MVGKLANIVTEMSEMNKAAEGVLKQVVTGEEMTIEKKNKDPFETSISARLTFATNVLPGFVDRSNGLWRRMVLVPFNFQLLNERSQNKSLIDPGWWINSGELPGIFNWAIAGLIRLQKRGFFMEPAECLLAKEKYKRDANPAKTFLREFCEEFPGSETSSNELYVAYQDFVKGRGQNPLSEPNFGQEVRRMFPNAKKSENALRQLGGSRSHVWQGVRLMPLNENGPWHS